jgi:hypothetical protein
MRRLLVAVLPWLPVCVVGALTAYPEIFTSFSGHDDEGYLLVSLSEFLRGQSLYDDVYTQYGPFYYLLFGSLFELSGRPVTTDAGRIVVIAIWLGTATLHGVAAYRLTRRLDVAIGAQIVAFIVLTLLVGEPMHPVVLTVLLLAAGLVVATWTSMSASAAAAGLGVLVAALLMTKVNVGALAAVAAVAAATLSLPPLCHRRAFRLGALALLGITPLALLGPIWARRGSGSCSSWSSQRLPRPRCELGPSVARPAGRRRPKRSTAGDGSWSSSAWGSPASCSWV